MTPNGLVTLLTDFGVRDPFVGVMKGVMLGVGARLTFVDLTHAIEAQRVGDAAFWLGHAYGWFPPGTLHLAVVDPGVGTERAAVVARGGGHFFVAPDNGVLEVVARRCPELEVRQIDVERLGLDVRSRTFHGRDVFAPVAARVALGLLGFEQVGPVRAPAPTANVPEPVVGGQNARGVVTVIDHFGNLITNVAASTLPAGTAWCVGIAGQKLPVVGTFADVPPGALAAVVGSFGELEVFARNGSAAALLSAERGTPVDVSW